MVKKIKLIKCQFMKFSTRLAIPDPPLIQPGDTVLTCRGIWYGQGYYPPYDCNDCPINTDRKNWIDSIGLI